MYKIGQVKRYSRRRILKSLLILVPLTGAIVALGLYALNRSSPTVIKQTSASSQVFDPSDTKNNIKIDTPLYTMQLPSDWKKISENKDTRYSSIVWQMQSGIKNRWIELYTDRIPTDLPVNKVIPITITDNKISPETLSENCAKFTPANGTNYKVPSRWQNATFLCDLSNKTDNIIGVSDIGMGAIFSLTGKTQGTHTYMFIYTDRGIPEDQEPIMTALKTLTPK